jgi:hypothetical protein
MHMPTRMAKSKVLTPAQTRFRGPGDPSPHAEKGEQPLGQVTPFRLKTRAGGSSQGEDHRRPVEVTWAKPGISM